MGKHVLVIYCKDQIVTPSGESVPKVLVNVYDEDDDGLLLAQTAQKEINEFGTLNAKMGYTEKKYLYADLQYES